MKFIEKLQKIQWGTRFLLVLCTKLQICKEQCILWILLLGVLCLVNLFYTAQHIILFFVCLTEQHIQNTTVMFQHKSGFVIFCFLQASYNIKDTTTHNYWFIFSIMDPCVYIITHHVLENALNISTPFLIISLKITTPYPYRSGKEVPCQHTPHSLH